MTPNSKLSIVTGAASGIGRAVAVKLASTGARVALVDRDEEGLTQTAALLEQRNALQYRVDLSEAGAILKMRDDIVAAAGLPDVIVNAAGFDRIEPFLDNDDELWTRLTAVNFLGPVRICHAFLTAIVQSQEKARIVNIASDAGRVGSMGETVYSGTKGGLIAFTKSLAREMARHGINVNCVCPGPTDTPLFATAPENIRRGLEKAIPFRRLATAAEIADAVAFLASDAASFITGQVLSVSGGLTMAG